VVPFVISVLGLKKSGKTTVVEGLVAELRRRGYRVGAIKSMVHSTFTFDQKGKDTKRHADAGADFVIALSKSSVLYLEPGKREREGIASLSRLFPQGVQFIVAEGLEETPSPGIQILALREEGFLDETIAVRGADRHLIAAVSGLIASRLRRIGPFEAFDVMSSTDRERLADLVLSRAGSPPPGSEPGGPLISDPSWRPGVLPPGEYPPIPDDLQGAGH
jgi:molybdopterin-guanine dinucleotide biosynthesis protein MobB